MDSEKDRPADGESTPVMVGLRPPELEIIDTLISAGVAPNRAEAVRWALARISERAACSAARREAAYERFRAFGGGGIFCLRPAG